MTFVHAEFLSTFHSHNCKTENAVKNAVSRERLANSLCSYSAISAFFCCNSRHTIPEFGMLGFSLHISKIATTKRKLPFYWTFSRYILVPSLGYYRTTICSSFLHAPTASCIYIANAIQVWSCTYSNMYRCTKWLTQVYTKYSCVQQRCEEISWGGGQ